MVKSISYWFIIILSVHIATLQAEDCSDNPAPKADLTTEQAWIDEVVEHHNRYRRRHQVDDLKFNVELAKISQFWANYLSSTNRFDFSYHKGLQENIWGWICPLRYYRINPVQTVNEWYVPMTTFNFATGHNGNLDSAKFIAKDLSEIGVAYACYKHGRSKFYVVIANYCGRPSGDFKTNILPSTSGYDYIQNPNWTNLSKTIGSCKDPSQLASDRAGIANSTSTNDTSSNSTATPSTLSMITWRNHGLILILWLCSILPCIMMLS